MSDKKYVTLFSFLGGCLAATALMFSLGASTPEKELRHEYAVDFETITIGSEKLAIQITDQKSKKCHLYIVPEPRKQSSRGDSEVDRKPPRLMMSIDLKTTGDATLGTVFAHDVREVRRPLDEELAEIRQKTKPWKPLPNDQ